MWIREIDLLAGGKRFQSYGDNALEIELDIKFGDKKEPDVSTISIYNLSNSSVNQIKEDGYCIVNAGYRDGIKACILNGQIESVEEEWQGLDKKVTITVGDGAKQWRKETYKKTYKEGTKASQIMNDLGLALGYELLDIEPKDDIEYTLGKTISGSASKSLTQLVEDTKSKMFINKNRLIIRDENKGTNLGFLLNSDTGLLDSPTKNKDGTHDKTDEIDSKKNKKQSEKKEETWNVNCLMNPQIETDSIIMVESKTLNGKCRVKKGSIDGQFNMQLEVVQI